MTLCSLFSDSRPRGAVVAGIKSGCGKTQAALGLMRALARRGVRVQPFKAGPDFIDPAHHLRAAGRESCNLDGWIMGGANMAELFSEYVFPQRSPGPEIALVEGVMGLFDGASGREDSGSTAELAKALDLPVILVVDGSSMARSAAAMVSGYLDFDPSLRFAGILFNRVGGPGHVEILQEAMTLRPEVEVLGFLPKRDDLALESRHLGLVTPQDLAHPPGHLDRLADWVEENVNLQRLVSRFAPISPPDKAGRPARPNLPPRARLGVAKDDVFCFCYPENLRILENCGAELVFFSPLSDARLPRGLDGLYLVGGYPEMRAEELSANQSMISDIRDFCRSGRPVYAECGGFMYLARSIRTPDGVFPMCGIFDLDCAMGERFRALGYREITTMEDSILGPGVTVVRGHEFHYSHIAGPIDYELLRPLYRMRDRKGWMDRMEGFRSGRVLGSYIHLHFTSNPGAAEALVAACATSRPTNS